MMRLTVKENSFICCRHYRLLFSGLNYSANFPVSIATTSPECRSPRYIGNFFCKLWISGLTDCRAR